MKRSGVLLINRVFLAMVVLLLASGADPLGSAQPSSAAAPAQPAGPLPHTEGLHTTGAFVHPGGLLTRPTWTGSRRR